MKCQLFESNILSNLYCRDLFYYVKANKHLKDIPDHNGLILKLQEKLHDAGLDEELILESKQN